MDFYNPTVGALDARQVGPNMEYTPIPFVVQIDHNISSFGICVQKMLDLPL